MFTAYFDVVLTGLLFSNLTRIDAEATLTVTRVSKHKKSQDRCHIFDSIFFNKESSHGDFMREFLFFSQVSLSKAVVYLRLKFRYRRE